MWAHEQKILMGQPIHYTLPSDLRFQSLARTRGQEAVRLRFGRDEQTIVDIPLSAEAVVALAKALIGLAGTSPDDVKRTLDEFHVDESRVLP